MLLESEQLAEKISAAESTKTVENCTFYEGEPPSCGLVQLGKNKISFIMTT